jgi:ABC-2 type transport system permease protein
MPAFMLIGGVSELLLIGWATSRPITNLPLMVFDQDRSAASRSVIDALANTGTFAYPTYADDMTSIQQALVRSQINAAIVIPAGFNRQMTASAGHPTLQVLLNGAESTAASTAQQAIEGVANDLNVQLAASRLGSSGNAIAAFDPSVRVWFNEALSEALYTTPAELALMLEFTVLVFAALSFARERELGTLEQLLVMPFSSLEIIIGKSVPAILVGFVDFVFMLGVVHFAFAVPVRGSLVLLLVLAAIYLIVELGKGMIISVSSRTQHQAFLLVMLLGMTDFLFTGYAAPVESMPPVLQFISNFIPAYHWLAIVRGVMLKGVGLDVLWPHVLALIALGLAIGTVAVRFVRRALD